MAFDGECVYDQQSERPWALNESLGKVKKSVAAWVCQKPSHNLYSESGAKRERRREREEESN